MYVDEETVWSTWRLAAAQCGLRYRHATRGFQQAQLGPMMIWGTSTLVAGESGHIRDGDTVRFVDPVEANENIPDPHAGAPFYPYVTVTVNIELSDKK